MSYFTNFKEFFYTMILHETILDLQLEELKYLGIKPEECLFFDIETTGLSWKTSYLYLLGIVYFENSHWKKILWFSQRPSDEKEILTKFSQLLYEKKYLIHFNGRTFDVPYLMHKYNFYQMEQSWDHLTQIDIYQILLPFKNIFQINNMKQRSIEQFIGLYREDPYSGKELISMYKEYLCTGDVNLQQILFLHNSEDIDGLLSLIPLVSVLQIFHKDISIFLDSPIITEIDDNFLVLTGILTLAFPVPLKIQTDLYQIVCNQNTFTIKISIYKGNLKFFFPDYKNYYYLKLEDEAIHKSIGAYVDKEYRENAKANNCYKKVTGNFIPQLSTLFNPVFLENYKDSFSRFEISEQFLCDQDLLITYISHLFQHALKLVK